MLERSEKQHLYLELSGPSVFPQFSCGRLYALVHACTGITSRKTKSQTGYVRNLTSSISNTIFSAITSDILSVLISRPLYLPYGACRVLKIRFTLTNMARRCRRRRPRHMDISDKSLLMHLEKCPM